jgi:hypothetical protein
MKLKCKKDYFLAIGTTMFKKDKWYDVIDKISPSERFCYKMIAEDGRVFKFREKNNIPRYFHTVDEVREIEIDKIINEIKM